MQVFPGELTFITDVALLVYFFHVYARNTENSSIKKNRLSFIFLRSVLNIYVPLVNLYNRIVAHKSSQFIKQTITSNIKCS